MKISEDVTYDTKSAAGFLDRSVFTLRRWRQLTRKTGVLHGPRFTRPGGTGNPVYKLSDLIDFREGAGDEWA